MSPVGSRSSSDQAFARNIWLQSLRGGPPRQTTEWRGDRVLYFEWSRNGQLLAFSREGPANEVVLIRDVR